MTFRDLRLRVRALLNPRRAERELDDELDFHIEMETRRQLAAGRSPEDARSRARARFGSKAVAAEQCRDARGVTFVESCVQDVAYALRGFRRAPTVALTVVCTIALGLGLTAAVFTVFNAFAFHVDAVSDPKTLVAVAWAPSGESSGRMAFTLNMYEALRRENAVFSDVGARRWEITTRIEGRMMEALLVTGNYFQMLGVGPALGRTITPADDTRTVERPAIVLSHRGWQKLGGSDQSILGRSVLVNGLPVEIVGVMPEGIGGVGFLAIDFWAPLSSLSHFRPQARLDNPGNLEVVGRLKPGVTRAAARAGLVLWATQTASALPPGQRAEDIRVESTTAFPTDMLLGFSPLFIAFGLVLAIGCANVANLLLARALSRQREIGIRLSLGASRRRVIRQLLTESLLLAFVSAACALAISRVVLRGGLHALVSTMPPELAELLSIVPPDADLRVVGFLVVAAVISAAFFGVLPALHATRLDLVRAIRGDVTRDGRPKRRSLAMIGGGSYGSAGRARNGLIIAQVIASTLLLVCAGVFLRGALRAQAVDPGLRVADTIVVEFANKFRPALVAAVSAEPSVAAVVAAWPGAPLASRSREAYGLSAGTTGTPLGYRFVSHGYFEMFEIGVVAGRVFTEAECRSTSAVAVVSESVARAIWPNGNPVGQVLRLTPGGITVRRNEPALPSQALVVIGVVRDVPGFQMAWPEAGVYVPFDVSSPEAALIARAHGDPEPTRRALLRNLTRIDPNMHQVVTMRTLASLQTYPLQVGFWLTLVLGGLALVLTASGVYGVLSFLVVQRTKEFGVRVALGATTGDITRLVISQSLRVVAIGLAIGVGLAWAGSTALMATPVAEKITGIISVFDGVAYVGSLVFIVVASTIAAAVPAQRAARIDPIATLREE